MSVVVLGMEMPGGCYICPLATHYGCLAMMKIFSKLTNVAVRPKGCPLRPLPEKHGRLIDCDEFVAQMRERQEAAYAWMENAQDDEARVRAEAVISFISEVTLTLAKMETIIEAEE